MRARCAAICAAAIVFIALMGTGRAGDTPEGTITSVDRALCDDMRTHNVIRSGAIVGCDRLKLIKFSYLGFDESIHADGEIMVMDAVAENVLRIFAKLRNMRFPIAKAILINHYDGDDDASIADNNTSAFNSRNVAGTNSLSLHAFGLAIDINPVQNPYLQRVGGKWTFNPPASAAYANRRNVRPGMAETIIDVFADEGFSVWGGQWTSPDYQHFQVPRGLAQQLARLSSAQAQALFRQHVQRYRACRKGGPAQVAC
jgi:D-alanyl-D-alanine carboxypeptidase-like protein